MTPGRGPSAFLTPTPTTIAAGETVGFGPRCNHMPTPVRVAFLTLLGCGSVASVATAYQPKLRLHQAPHLLNDAARFIAQEGWDTLTLYRRRLTYPAILRTCLGSAVRHVPRRVAPVGRV
jgi:hypothetical protein